MRLRGRYNSRKVKENRVLCWIRDYSYMFNIQSMSMSNECNLRHCYEQSIETQCMIEILMNWEKQ